MFYSREKYTKFIDFRILQVLYGVLRVRGTLVVRTEYSDGVVLITHQLIRTVRITKQDL